MEELKSGVSIPLKAEQETLDIEEIIKVKKGDIEDSIKMNDPYRPQLD